MPLIPPPAPSFQSGEQLCAEDLNNLFTSITGWICQAVADGTIYEVPPNVLLADGSVPMDGCLILKQGCVESNSAITVGMVNDLIAGLNVKPQCFSQGLGVQNTDPNGEFCVPVSGITSIQSITATPIGNSHTISVVSQSPTEVCFAVTNAAGMLVTNSPVNLSYLIVGV